MKTLTLFATLAAVSFIGLYSTAKVIAPPVITMEEKVVTTPVVVNTQTGIKINLKAQSVTSVNAKIERTLFLQSQVDQQVVDKLISQLQEMNNRKGEIYLFIDSPGGSVLDGARLLDAMEASKNPVNTVCVGLCASMAAIIHQHGAKRLAQKHSLLMFHPASGGAQGQVPNIISRMTAIQKYVNKMNDKIVGSSKISKEEYEKLVAYELWIDGEDAVAKGFVDKLVYLNVEMPKQEETIRFLIPPGEKVQNPSAPNRTRWFDFNMLLESNK